MTTHALSPPQSVRRVAVARPSALAWSLSGSLEAAEADWRALEARGVLTPYQRFDWVRQYLRSGFVRDAEIRVLVLRSADKTVAIMPLEIVSRFGLRVACIVGMPIANSDSLVLDPDHAESITPVVIADAFSVLRESGVRVDIASFNCVVESWQGIGNPLMALPHAPAPNHLYLSALEPGDKPYIEAALPHKRRTNVRRSRRRLSEHFGPLELVQAKTPDEARRIHETFLDQRARRFAEMGVENVFARKAFVNQLLDCAIESLDRDEPTVTFHGLKAGETMLATSIGVRSPGHYSQYINSTTYGEAAKYSLMGVLMSFLIDELRNEGVTSIDMGLGDFDYKSDWTHRHAVHDVVLPVSPLGRLFAPILRLARRVKREIKQNPAVWRLVKPLLALKARLSRRGAASPERG